MNPQKLIDIGESAIVVLILCLGMFALIEALLHIIFEYGYFVFLVVALFIFGAISIVMGVWLQRGS